MNEYGCRISKVIFKDGKELTILPDKKFSSFETLFLTALKIARENKCDNAGYFITTDEGIKMNYWKEKSSWSALAGASAALKDFIMRDWE